MIWKVYKQQQYMYENGTHSVPNRIVSISQPYIRPIVRGKAKTPTEFGAKLDLSIDDNGMAKLEKQSFDAYNEATTSSVRQRVIISEPADIHKGSWRIRPTRTERTLLSAKNMGSDYPGRHWAGRKKIRMWTRNRNTQIR